MIWSTIRKNLDPKMVLLIYAPKKAHTTLLRQSSYIYVSFLFSETKME